MLDAGSDLGGEQVAPRGPEKRQHGIVLERRRIGHVHAVARAVCCIVETRSGTTYDNFARDFGERFVPGYNAPSTVDYLLSSPFKE
jgi:hypothetical protein